MNGITIILSNTSCIYRINYFIFGNVWHGILNLNTHDLEIIKNIRLDTKGVNFLNFTLYTSLFYIPLLAMLDVVIWPAWVTQTIPRVLLHSSPRRMLSVTCSCRSPAEVSITKDKLNVLNFFSPLRSRFSQIYLYHHVVFFQGLIQNPNKSMGIFQRKFFQILIPFVA